MIEVLSTLCWTGFIMAAVGAIVGVNADRNGSDWGDGFGAGWFFLGLALLAVPGLMLVGVAIAGGF